jgi:hypothetical protein
MNRSERLVGLLAARRPEPAMTVAPVNSGRIAAPVVAVVGWPRTSYKTPGRFRTRVITNGVVPSLHVDYRNTKIKQYHKEGRALRTETTINDPREFGLSKRLTNLPALRQIGFTANRRLARRPTPAGLRGRGRHGRHIPARAVAAHPSSMTTWITLLALTVLFALALRHGRSKELPMPPGYDGERQLAELHALISAHHPLRLP